MVDIVLESIRAFVLLGIWIYLRHAGHGRFHGARWGWPLILAGFGLLFFGSLLDITDNFESLNRFVIIGDTEAEAFLEKFVGFLGGFVLLAIGLIRWIPSVQRMQRELEERVQQRTHDIQRDKSELESEVLARTADLRKNEEALKSSEEKFRQMAENISEVFWMTDPAKSEMIYISPIYEKIWRRSCESLFENPLSFVEAIHPEDRERVVEAFKKQSRGEYDEEYRIVQPDGTVRLIRDRAFPIRNEHGEIYRLVGIADDVTEARLRDEQLGQAQKMEAVGQLTGGVAHDFNNLLTVILGNAELLKDQAGVVGKPLNDIRHAALRGAELTQRLLAFSRRQPLRPRPINPAGLLDGMLDLLGRTLGETIQIETIVGSDLWLASADPGQVENALLNLAINARDAMPGGGKLTIECANARFDEAYLDENPEAKLGDYVMLAVGDEGHGMTAEVQVHVFEPFYTTKEVGQGSGLGLSMVYGFAKQSGGHVTIDSEDGRGTTVKLYLPRTEEVSETRETQPGEEVPRGRGELILVIEDDHDVRRLVVQILESLDYRVIDVGDPAGARTVLADNKPVDLVLSDVVLPGGTSGPEFIAEISATHPDLKVIFISGYPAEATKRNGFLDSDKKLLSKPFEKQQLAKALRDELDGRGAK